MTLQHMAGGAFLPFATLHFLDLGIDYAGIGWMFLAAAAVSATVPFLWGFLADRYIQVGRLYAFLHLLGAAALLALAQARTFPACLIALTLFVGFYPPTTALLFALSYHVLKAPAAQFGRLRVWGSVGWMVPSLPVYAWLAFSETGDLSFTPVLAAGFEVLTALFALALPRPAAGGTEGSVAAGQLSYGPALRTLFWNSGFVALLAIAFLMQASFAIAAYYAGPLIVACGVARKWVGPAQSLGVAIEVPLFFLLSASIRRLGFRGTMAVGCIALVVRQLICSLSSSPWLLVASYVLPGVCVVFYLTAMSLAVNSLAGSSVRATAQTLLTLIGPGLGQMTAHRAAGWIATESQGRLAPVFLFAAGCAGAALGILAWEGRRRAGAVSSSPQPSVSSPPQSPQSNGSLPVGSCPADGNGAAGAAPPWKR
jgi:hypothetical protein